MFGYLMSVALLFGPLIISFFGLIEVYQIFGAFIGAFIGIIIVVVVGIRGATKNKR